MGLLDELEQEAQRRRGADAQVEAEASARDLNWREKLKPAMEQLAAYLKKLTEHLAFLKRRVRVVYVVPGYGEVIAYVDPVYEFRDAPAKSQHEITLDFSAQVATDECAIVDVEGLTKVRAVNSAFQQVRLSGMQDPRKNANGDVVGAKFQARGKIPLKLTITADRDSGVARMSFVNFEGISSTARNFAPDLLTPAMFDALGRYIAREESTFAQESVGDDLRRQLQTRIQREQLKREWEEKLARQVDDDEAKVLSYMGSGPGSFIGRIARAAKKLAGR